jgi:translocation and assembly module TamA
MAAQSTPQLPDNAKETGKFQPSTTELDQSSTAADLEDITWAASPTPTHFKLGSAKGQWRALLEQHVPVLNENAEAQTLTPGLLRKLRSDITTLLATEGYFSPTVLFEKDKGNSSLVLMQIEVGQVTKVRQLDIRFEGELGQAIAAKQAEALQRQAKSQAAWPLAAGSIFRDDDWRNAKNQLVDQLRADRYAAAKLVDSDVVVDADQFGADLRLTVDSGPTFLLGDLHITGLERYPSWLLERFNPPKRGEIFSRARLFEYQRALQNSAYFATVTVNVEPDTAQAAAVPIDVTVTERRSRDIGIGAGYSTNTGLRTELSYRDRNLFEKAWELRSAVRIEQKRQLAYTDIYLPPRASNQLDSFGVLFDRLDVSGLLQTRAAFGVKRTITDGKWERRYGINVSHEKLELDGAASERNQALVASFGVTWRQVDHSFAPRDGQIVQLDTAVSEKVFISDQSFLRLNLKYQHWIPVASKDHILLRAEVGEVFAPNPPGSDGIPEDYLFRTGGSTSVRGFAYQSLGIPHPGGVTGGRVLGVASAEYVHQFNATWGAATFVDVGDAARTWRDFQSKQGLGVGARYQTPAGPIALDLAYGRQVRKLRLDFSISVAF